MNDSQEVHDAMVAEVGQGLIRWLLCLKATAADDAAGKALLFRGLVAICTDSAMDYESVAS